MNSTHIPCKAGQGFVHFDAESAAQCTICHPPIRRKPKDTLLTFARLVHNQCNGDLSDAELRRYLAQESGRILDFLEEVVRLTGEDALCAEVP